MSINEELLATAMNRCQMKYIIFQYTLMGMKHIYISFIILFSACGQKGELIKHNWIVTDGTYNGNQIKFKGTNRLKMIDKKGKEIISLHFFENGEITLPGINSSDLSSKWTINNDKIYLVIDSPFYNRIYGRNIDLSFLETNDSLSNKNEIDEDKKGEIINPLLTNEFNDAMKVYEYPFNYWISRDTLFLVSEKTKIREARDRTIDEMFKNL